MASGGNVESSRLKSSKYLAKTGLDFVFKKWVNEQAEIRKRLWFACPASFSVQDGGCVTKSTILFPNSCLNFSLTSKKFRFSLTFH